MPGMTPTHDGTLPRFCHLQSVSDAWRTLYGAGHRPAYMGDDDTRRDGAGFYIEGIDTDHIIVTAPDMDPVILDAYAAALTAAGWRDVKIVRSVLRPQSVLATMAGAPVLEHLRTREQFTAFALKHGITSFHEPDEQGVSARVIGRSLDTACSWIPRNGEASAIDLHVIYTLENTDVAYVSLGMLSSWAVGPEVPAALEGGEFLDLYHRTTPDAAAEIYREQRMFPHENGGRLFFSTATDGRHSNAYGSAVVHVRVPASLATLDDEYQDGERHYSVQASVLRPEHFIK